MASIKVLHFNFEGPFATFLDLRKEPGVLVVHDYYNGQYFLKDVDYLEKCYEGVRDHPRKGCWERHKFGAILFSIYYINNKEEGIKMSEEIRGSFMPVCN